MRFSVIRWFVLLLSAILLLACGDDPTSDADPIPWTLFEPEQWVGKAIDATDLAKYLDMTALPDDGIWVLWRDSGEPCAELFAHLEGVERDKQPVVLVLMPERNLPEAERRVQELPKGENVIQVALPADRDWVVTAPVVLVLRARNVVSAAQGVLAESHIPIPIWAKVAPEQIGEAKKHGVPVAFENDIGMRFVLIPAGTFMMGSPEGEEGHVLDRHVSHPMMRDAALPKCVDGLNPSPAPPRPDAASTRVQFSSGTASSGRLTQDSGAQGVSLLFP